jgi:uncharacterized membrane protein YdfJ with MMPL/SSD domain
MGDGVGRAGRASRLIFRRRRAILAGFAVLVVAAAAFALPVFSELGSDNDFDDPHAEAVQARERIMDASGESAAPAIVALVRSASRERIGEVRRALQVPGVARVTGGDAVSKDRRSTYLLV